MLYEKPSHLEPVSELFSPYPPEQWGQLGVELAEEFFTRTRFYFISIPARKGFLEYFGQSARQLLGRITLKYPNPIGHEADQTFKMLKRCDYPRSLRLVVDQDDTTSTMIRPKQCRDVWEVPGMKKLRMESNSLAGARDALN
ncbi:hypothetical protein FGG08_002893 [Glutinoglossum americanum]|uniref:Uncharacterized protein n=1 Tax=Glutinoglossum americanum TaxID=1670608 RepID=A0A9P8HZE7_9PEZI|nr:hypothetical protein FGG08_002893 [Glutinoglossum americanum]